MLYNLKKIFIFASGAIVLISLLFWLDAWSDTSRIILSIWLASGMLFWFLLQHQKNEYFDEKYTVFLTKEIVQKDEKYSSTLIYKIKLPFIPFIGLDISEESREYQSIISATLRPSGDDDVIVRVDSKFWSEEITYVRWDNDNKTYFCKTQLRNLTDKNDLGAVLDSYMRRGWQLEFPSDIEKKSVKDWQKSKVS